MIAKRINIAIDGPAASGKSTIGKILSKKNNLVFVSSGLIFRSYAYLLIKNNLKLSTYEEKLSFLSNIKLIWKNNLFFLNDVDITSFLKTDDVANLASEIAKDKNIRLLFNNFLQKISLNNNVLIEGRDIGTIILPNANLKIFLNAPLSERAKRRSQENNTSFIKNFFYLFKRDLNDKYRKISPLKKAEDAYLVSTSNKSIDQVVNEIQDLISKKVLLC